MSDNERQVTLAVSIGVAIVALVVVAAVLGLGKLLTGY
jgi:hypothetical protein